MHDIFLVTQSDLWYAEKGSLMHGNLIPLIVVSLLMVSWFIKYCNYLSSIVIICAYESLTFALNPVQQTVNAKKSRSYPFPTKRPECPLFQAEEMFPSEVTPPESQTKIIFSRGRPRSIHTDLHYCPESECGNICGNGHKNSISWRQLKSLVCGTYFMKIHQTFSRLYQ